MLCNPAPTPALPAKDALSRFHFTRVLVFRELHDAARFSQRMCARVFEAEGMWRSVLGKHLDVLGELAVALRGVSEGSAGLAEGRGVSGEKGTLDTLFRSLRALAPRLVSELGLGAMLSLPSAEQSLERELTDIVDALDLHSACVSSLASWMTESQKPYTHQHQHFSCDPRGTCLGGIGRVLCHLLDLTICVENVVASDAYVSPEVKLALGGNQMLRSSLASFAIELDSAIYNIVCTFYQAIPDMMGHATNECRDWISWSPRPQKDWKDLYLPRLQCYMAFKTAVLPAGAPLPLKKLP
mmetsp:Transcript_43411/g.108828  ORF Transcript_43411/g.108828 Transcript_43411/m.108828 type:complete len:298 (-) Transcript_43411:310-1203(-)